MVSEFDGGFILQGDALEVLKSLPDETVQCCITSPPYYGLRDYGAAGQIGLEASPEEFVAKLVETFREVRRVLKSDGVCFVNLGDSYAGGAGRWGGSNGLSEKQATNDGSLTQIPVARKWHHETIKPKDLIGIPWRFAFAAQDDGWYLRQDIIWHKPNPMPESVKDRCTKAHEYIFMLTKSPKYYFNNEAIKEPAISAGQKRGGGKKYSSDEAGESFGRKEGQRLDQYGVSPDYKNKRSVWTVATKSYKEAHFATYPESLVEPMLLAGSRKGDIILDPFNGAATTGLVALRNQRRYIGVELNPEYIALSERRLKNL